MDKISIVIPCFNEEEAIPVYYMEMKKIMKEMSYVGFELFFVDDGSSDRTLQESTDVCQLYAFSVCCLFRCG